MPDDSSVFITGNLPLLGNWNPGRVPMKNIGNHVWTYSMELDNTLSVEYKYTRGSWELEGADNDGLSLPNFSAKIHENCIITDTVANWTSPGKKIIKGQITGTVTYHHQMVGFDLEPRDVIVWLPPGYENSGNKKYPVLYMQDGQNIFDPATSAFGVDWQIDETCDSLIHHQLIEPLIIVGIYSTPQRMHEYIPNDTAQRYMKLVIQTIKPIIDSTYRTLTNREHTFVGGSSAGGIISFMLCWEYPEVFSKAICMSPAFKIERIDYVKTVETYNAKKKDLYFYIDNGGRDLETYLQPGIDEMLNALNTKGFKKDTEYYWQSFPEATHNEAAWAKRFPTAIQWIMKVDKNKKK
ncbi:MAG: alpha/beta hydrolase-fold protein [Salinivirgaceae bacterium]